MKILIVDTNVEEKYFNIIKELEKRKFEILIVQAANTAMCEIVMDINNLIQGIILGMDIPIKKDEEVSHIRGGEELLKRMSREDIIDIPVLVYSENAPASNYVQLFDHMKDWKEKEKLLDFLDEIQKASLNIPQKNLLHKFFAGEQRRGMKSNIKVQKILIMPLLFLYEK